MHTLTEVLNRGFKSLVSLKFPIFSKFPQTKPKHLSLFPTEPIENLLGNHDKEVLSQTHGGNKHKNCEVLTHPDSAY